MHLAVCSAVVVHERIHLLEHFGERLGLFEQVVQEPEAEAERCVVHVQQHEVVARAVLRALPVRPHRAQSRLGELGRVLLHEELLWRRLLREATHRAVRLREQPMRQSDVEQVEVAPDCVQWALHLPRGEAALLRPAPEEALEDAHKERALEQFVEARGGLALGTTPCRARRSRWLALGDHRLDRLSKAAAERVQVAVEHRAGAGTPRVVDEEVGVARGEAVHVLVGLLGDRVEAQLRVRLDVRERARVRQQRHPVGE